jgi:hypothetical protein
LCDEISSYFGISGIELRGGALRLNGEAIYLRWCLTRDTFPVAIMTAASDEHRKQTLLDEMLDSTALASTKRSKIALCCTGAIVSACWLGRDAKRPRMVIASGRILSAECNVRAA